MKNVSIAAIQSKCPDEVSQNLEQAISEIESAAKNGAQLVCLQELFASKYFLSVRRPRAICVGRVDSGTYHGPPERDRESSIKS